MKYRLLNLNWIYGRENTADMPRPSLTSTFDPTLVRGGFETQQTLPTLRQTATAANKIAGSATQALTGLGQAARAVTDTVTAPARVATATQALAGVEQAVTAADRVAATATQALGALGQAATAVGAVAPAFQVDFTGITSLPSEISLSRATTGTYFNASGVLQTAATNAARFDHDQSTHAAKGILVEEQRTNILTQSNNFTNSQWILANTAVSVSSNNSPDGTTDAFTLTIAPSAGSILYQPITSATSVTYTGSIWARVTTGTGKLYLGLQNAGNVAQTVTACSLTTSWQRFSVTYTHPGSTMYFVLGQRADGTTTDASSSVEIFGGQVELGSFATSYIPTTTAAVTRSADIAQLTGAALTAALAAAGSLIVQVGSVSAGPPARIIGSNQNDSLINLASQADLQIYNSSIGTLADAFNAGADFRTLPPNRMAVSWDASPAESIVFNGGTVATGTYLVKDAGVTNILLGSNANGAGLFANTWFQSIAVYSARLSDADLQTKSVVGASY